MRSATRPRYDPRMTGEATALPWVSYGEYLALERETNQRHEWFDGRVYAMAGGTLPHAELASAMLGELRNLALACGCRVFSSDAKVRVKATGLATYPDGSMVCGRVETDPEDPNAMVNPTLIVEVLSDSNEGYDRGEKWAHYRRIPSLKDYVLISQHTRRIEVFSRDGDHWTLRIAEEGDAVKLTALEGAILVDRVYLGVELTPDTRLPPQ